MDSVTKRRHTLTDHESAHPWLADNKYLTTGYRKDFNFSLSLRSLFMKHNEVMNIWTHLVGAIIFIIVMVFVVNHYSGSARTHSSIKDSFQVTGAFQDIRKKYEANRALLFDLTHNKDAYLLLRSDISNDDKSQIRSFSTDIIDIYRNLLDQLVQDLEANEAQFLTQFNRGYDYIKTAIEKTMKIISVKYNKVIDNKTKDIQKLYKKFEKCFHSDTISHLLASNLHPHLEYYPIVIYIICAVTCLGFSTIFHTFTSMSYIVHKILHRLDMAGISILNFGSSFALFYYNLYCHPSLLFIYSSILFIACLTVFFVSLTDKIHELQYVKHKSLMFAFLGLSNAIPFTHLAWLAYQASSENDSMPFNISFLGIVLMAILYLSGLYIYAIKFPEKYYPKKFDIWLNSHVIWHLFVFSAAVVHFFNVVYSYELRKTIHCISC